MMHYTAKVFRPPFEEKSLLIEATVGCSRDKCAFCSLYHDTPFAPAPMEHIESDIDGGQMSIYDLMGRMVYQSEYQTEIPVNQLNEGLYFLSITTNEGQVINQKFIIRK